MTFYVKVLFSCAATLYIVLSAVRCSLLVTLFLKVKLKQYLSCATICQLLALLRLSMAKQTFEVRGRNQRSSRRESCSSPSHHKFHRHQTDHN